MLDLRLLQSFVVVAETEHVGRAAEILHISQSPLSRQIRQLEDDLGLRLFDREKQRIRLTDAGRWLLGEGRSLLDRAKRVEHDAARTARGEGGRLVVGFVNSALWNGVMPTALRRFHKAHPDVHIEVRALTSDMQVEGVLRGDLGVGIVHRRTDHAELVCVHLFDEPFLLAVPSRHPLATLETIRPKDVAGEPWIALSRTLYPAAHARFEQHARRAGVTPDVRHETGDRATALALVESGLGLAFVPGSARRVATPGITLRELPWLSMATGIRLIHRATPTIAEKHFVDIATATARATAPETKRRR